MGLGPYLRWQQRDFVRGDRRRTGGLIAQPRGQREARLEPVAEARAGDDTCVRKLGELTTADEGRGARVAEVSDRRARVEVADRAGHVEAEPQARREDDVRLTAEAVHDQKDVARRRDQREVRRVVRIEEQALALPRGTQDRRDASDGELV